MLFLSHFSGISESIFDRAWLKFYQGHNILYLLVHFTFITVVSLFMHVNVFMFTNWTSSHSISLYKNVTLVIRAFFHLIFSCMSHIFFTCLWWQTCVHFLSPTLSKSYHHTRLCNHLWQ